MWTTGNHPQENGAKATVSSDLLSHSLNTHMTSLIYRYVLVPVLVPVQVHVLVHVLVHVRVHVPVHTRT